MLSNPPPKYDPTPQNEDCKPPPPYLDEVAADKKVESSPIMTRMIPPSDYVILSSLFNKMIAKKVKTDEVVWDEVYSWAHQEKASWAQ